MLHEGADLRDLERLIVACPMAIEIEAGPVYPGKLF